MDKGKGLRDGERGWGEEATWMKTCYMHLSDPHEECQPCVLWVYAPKLKEEKKPSSGRANKSILGNARGKAEHTKTGKI